MFGLQSKRMGNGFTLIEVLVVVSIVGILAAVVGVNAVDSGRQGRDAERQADLRTLQSAIELYKNKYGRYPAACPTSSPLSEGWSGQQGTNYACSGGSTQYIVGLAPEFIPVLPVDPRLNGANSGYVYRTNAAGTVYKLKAQRTVETDEIDHTHPFKACDIRVGSDPASGNLLSGSTNREVIGWCGRVFPSNNLPSACRSTDPQWRSSYALWGGFEAKRTLPADPANSNPSIVQDTTDIICR